MLKRIDLTRDFARHRQEYLAAITAVCEETAFSGGKYADRFDEEFRAYLGAEAATGVNNGTSALQLAMLALGVGPGDEVIVPANTYIATAWGVTYTGATPVFADCTPDTWEIDAESVQKRITPRTKGILGVHLYGQPFDFAAVSAVAERWGLFVAEDCAQSAGAEFEGRKTGTLGEIGCFSFYPGKNLYAFGEGGAVTSNNPAYIDRINVYKNQGCRVRYYHETVGYNMRLEGMQGAVLSVSLHYLDGWNERRAQIGRRYDAQITNPLFLKQMHPANTKPVYHLYEVQVPDPEHFLAYMEQNGIECNRHYPVPCHLQEAYASLGYRKGDCPNAEQLAEHCATLPLFPEMTDDEAALVIEKCNAYRG
ncbi:MAG: DegT/DnrJ/EryC1/StrS family aminotransferase [Eubacteriales bacterium]|nr:DegT/DnrJ/EryC1/StrS family aminotransferase [Eubacteriales bacterium]